MNQGSKSGKRDVEGRILASATDLFAKFGYNGVSIRDIAAAARVNEVTVYRHYPRKRDLYVSVLAAELQQVKLGGELLARIAAADDAGTVLARTYELIATALLPRPELLRLMQFSALEMGEALDPLVHQHLGQLVEVLVHYLEPWVARRELRCDSAKSLVLSLVAIILSHSSLGRLFPGSGAGPEAMFSAFAASMVLGKPGAQPHPPGEQKASGELTTAGP
jgi:AcrR family transcriptional regulator